MTDRVARLFSPAELEHIKAAVVSAEKKTSGEIVPYVVERSDEYEVAVWRGGALLGVLTAAAFALVHSFTTIWLPLDFAGMIAATLLAGAMGALIAQFSPAAKRMLAGKELLTRRVGQRASAAFVAEEVFHTRDRTGILILLSIAERQVVVLGDAGINARVKQSDWDAIVQTVVQGMRDNKAADGLIRAIGMAGALLEQKGVAIRPDDTDELNDALRMSDR